MLLAWAPFAAEEASGLNGYEVLFRGTDAELNMSVSIGRITDYEKSIIAMERMALALRPWLRIESKLLVSNDELMPRLLANLGMA